MSDSESNEMKHWASEIGFYTITVDKATLTIPQVDKY